MKKYFLLFLSCLSFATLQAQYSPLEISCNTQIISEKLSYANQKSFNRQEFIESFAKLYQKCSPIINKDKNLPELQKSEWIENMIKETSTLQKDPETRNCFNQAIIQYKKIKKAPQKNENNNILNQFLKDFERCCDQYTLKVSLSHLDALIERWEQHKIDNTYACNKNQLRIIFENMSEEKNNLKEELQRNYELCSLATTISFDDFVQSTKELITTYKNNQPAYNCLEKFLIFQKSYEAAQTQEEKNKLKLEFAVPYLQCKNKK